MPYRPPQQHVIIIGAGFSGLTLAYFLAERSCRVSIFEKSERNGGLLGTYPAHQSELGFYETAANGLLRSPLVENLFRDLGIPIAASGSSTAQRRFIWRGSLKRWPLTWGETWELAKESLFKFILHRQSMRPSPGTKLIDWGQRFLPAAAQHFLLETGLQGIYGAKTKDLSASLVLGRIFEPNRTKYKGLISPEKGMQQLIQALTHHLKNRGVEFHHNEEISAEKLAELHRGSPNTPIVLCVKAHEAAQLLCEVDPNSAQELSKIRMHNKTTCTIFYESFPSNKRQWGFGCLIPPSSHPHWPLGILMNSFIFAGRDKCYNENWIFSDEATDFLKSASEGEIFAFLEKIRLDIFGEALKIREIGMRQWAPALPCYDINLEGVLARLKPKTGIFLNGNYLGKIGLTGILQRSLDLAQQITGAQESL